MYDSLHSMRQRLTTIEMTSLSERRGFSSHWRLLAGFLGFSAAEVERVQDAGHEDEEWCYQLLRRWDQRTHEGATVVVLVEGVCALQNNVMLEVAYSVFCG